MIDNIIYILKRKGSYRWKYASYQNGNLTYCWTNTIDESIKLLNKNKISSTKYKNIQEVRDKFKDKISYIIPYKPGMDKINIEKTYPELFI